MTRRAFTLVENLLAFTLISLVLILLLNLFPSSMATVRKSEQRYQALTLADSLIEQQASRPFSKLVVGNVLDEDRQEYHLHTEIMALPGEDQAWLKNVRVTVSWKYREQPRQVMREMRLHRLAHQL